jgi:Leucine-rich repeat (LRR) protein
MQNERDRSEIEIVQWLTELGVNWDGELADLQKLDLYGKNITSLPESIGRLTNLQELHIWDTPLSTLTA